MAVTKKPVAAKAAIAAAPEATTYDAATLTAITCACCPIVIQRSSATLTPQQLAEKIVKQAKAVYDELQPLIAPSE